MTIKNALLLFSLLLTVSIKAQTPVLIGYWHNWNTVASPYIPLDQIDGRYSVVCISFAVPTSTTDMTMLFTPDVVTQSTFINQVQTLHNQGKKVLLSVGGANATLAFSTTTQKNAFINSMTNLLNTYHFDGIDIDIEHGNCILASGTIAAPTSVDCLNLIAAIKQIKTNYFTANNKTMMLTFAPETAYVQGGMSAYSSIWGGYLPLLHALRNDINYVHVQLYNTGTIYGIDGNIYAQGTADFIVAMTEALIKGFNTAGGAFQGFPANKVVVGLPACPTSAGGGFTSTTVVESAMKYLKGTGAKPGSYTLVQTGGYSNLGGMMDWSINWDKVTSCNATTYEYAKNFAKIFAVELPITLTTFNARLINNAVQLNWTTSSEINEDYYEIEHATDGLLFEAIGKIAAQNKAAAEQNYQFIHDKINSGTHYYRLKSVELNNAFNYSKIVSIKYDTKSETIVFPNPVTDILYINNALNQDNPYKITNIQGQIVQQGVVDNNTVLINSLNKGVYFISIGNNFYKFVKK